ncbi:hypothetical protein RFF05_10030 [Bengtsoniella intestinalis]|uniref:hypothetical protein n=1 Tax=Bengtsoniella intestinalis TaxID=3073143 RepID=UPI00391F48F3
MKNCIAGTDCEVRKKTCEARATATAQPTDGLDWPSIWAVDRGGATRHRQRIPLAFVA